jgi:hypothetical protein
VKKITKTNVEMNEGAELWRVYNDGTEKLIAILKKEESTGKLKFVKINN